MPAPRAMAVGVSRWGSCISSDAALGASKPTKAKSATGTIARNPATVGRAADQSTPAVPDWATCTSAVRVRLARTNSLAHAPTLMSTLPRFRLTTARRIATQTNTSLTTKSPTADVATTYCDHTDPAMNASDPPSQIGFVIQYRITATDAHVRPNARRTHWYGPPSSGYVEEVSAKTKADGTRNAIPMNADHTSPSGPPPARTAMLSPLMTAATMNRTMSPRRRVFTRRLRATPSSGAGAGG